MLIANRRKKGPLTIVDAVFAESTDEVKDVDADVVKFINCKESYGNARTIDTQQINLLDSVEEIYAGFKKKYRKAIRVFLEDDPLVEYVFIDNPTPEEIETFAQEYDGFALHKGLAPFSRSMVAQYAQAGGCAIHYSRSENGDYYVRRFFLHDQKTVLGLYSLSPFRPEDEFLRLKSADANRCLHFKSMQHFKEAGYQVYDLGGLSLGMHDDDRGGIDQFKRGFGGVPVQLFSFFKGYTMAGKLAEKMFTVDI